MPIYEKCCKECGEHVDYFSSVANRNDGIGTCECGGEFERVISCIGYDSLPDQYPFTRRFGTKKVTIHNRAEKKRLFRENGLYEMPSNYGEESPNIGEY